jgi:DNA (cytosine-5)-methyltransferase 1|tara:strand:+ start:252 stop:1226 length:975 start_codon:yes stop_codon:yes gene_type:complete
MIRIIDLFAGIGGMRLGFEQAYRKNIECVFSSEWDKFAVQTYAANFNGEEPRGDITKIPSKSIPDHDILLAGFPCQPFSQAGLKRGFVDTRGTLFFEIEKILIKKKPQAFLLENVKHLKGHDNGRTFKVIMRHLEAAGYKIFVKTLNAKDFGVPHNRQRVFIVGFLDHSAGFSFPESKGKKIRVGDILEKHADSKYTISDKLWEGHQRRKSEHKAKGNGFGYGLFNSKSEYTNTISARYYKDGSEVLIDQERKNPRKLTPRECARLQGFRGSFKIPVSDNQAYRQFGNSVAVPVIKAIAKEMLEYIKDIHCSKRKISHKKTLAK